MARKFLTNPGSFCQMSQELTLVPQRRKFKAIMEKCYLHHFDFLVRHENKSWVSHISCISCVTDIVIWN